MSKEFEFPGLADKIASALSFQRHAKVPPSRVAFDRHELAYLHACISFYVSEQMLRRAEKLPLAGLPPIHIPDGSVREAAMSNKMTPQMCAEKSEQLIGQYVRELGAYGDPDRVRQALIMLVSKAALGLEVVAGIDRTTKILMETALNVATVVENRKRKKS